MELRSECLDPDEVAALIGGELEPRDIALAEAHVARCAECRMLLSLAVRSDSAAACPSAASSPTLGSAPDASTDTAANPTAGARIGRYELLERLGAGAMGVVFAAHDPELDRKVAVKVLRSDTDVDMSPASLETRLLREARAMAQLAHPNVVAVHDVGSFGDRIFIAMELVDGQTLAQWLAATRRPLGEVIIMFIAAGRGLAAAHAVGLVHRDFKPENVLIGRDGRVRVTDFGLAHRAALPVDPAAVAMGTVDRDRSTTGMFAGTPFYMAPEQMAGERVDARTDQFSFCVAIYAALTGEHPFSAGARGEQLAERPRRDVLPAWLWRALRPGLAVVQDRRYPSMDALLSRLAMAPRRWRPTRLAATAVVGAATALAIVARVTWSRVDHGTACEGTAHLLAGAWDHERAHSLEQAFRASGHNHAAAIFTAAARLLDQYSERWVAMHGEACEAARVRHIQTESVWQLRASCLDARLSELRALTAQLTTADTALVDRAVGAVQSLGTLGVCADEGALQSPTHPDVIARPGAIAMLDASRSLSYFVTNPDGSLWQSRTEPDGAGQERVHVLDAVVGRPTFAADAEHRLHVFARRRDGTLWRSSQDAPGGTWQSIQLTDGVTADPAVIPAGDKLVYFVRKTDGWLWRYSQDASGGTWTAVRVTDVVTGKPGVGFDAASELYSIVRKADGSLWSTRSTHHSDPAAAPDRSVKLNDNIASEPTVVRDTLKKLTYFARRTDGSLVAGYQEAPGSRVWHSVTLTTGVAGDPALAFDAEGKQVCLIRKTNGSLWSARQHAPAVGPWYETILTEGVADDPTVVLDAELRLTYFVHKTDGSLWQGRQDAPLSTTWHEHAVL